MPGLIRWWATNSVNILKGLLSLANKVKAMPSDLVFVQAFHMLPASYSHHFIVALYEECMMI